MKRLVLVGGGHAQLDFVASLGAAPLEGVQITLVSPEGRLLYSGMMPGYIAGHYALEECSIALAPLARKAGASLVADECVGIDAHAREVRLASGMTLSYDVLSLNIGGVSARATFDEGLRASFAVKPFHVFVAQWPRLKDELINAGAAQMLTVLGGGAAAVEVALAIDYAVRRACGGRRRPLLRLIAASDTLLPGAPAKAVQLAERALRRAGCEIRTGVTIVRETPGTLQTQSGEAIATDWALWATGVVPPPSLEVRGIERDARGFLKVEPTLAALGHRDVFVAGDMASFAQAVPKAGVYALRQGPVLNANLRHALKGEALQTFTPQPKFLALVSLGAKRAFAMRGPWAVQWPGFWWWKDYLDRDFVRRFAG